MLPNEGDTDVFRLNPWCGPFPSHQIEWKEKGRGEKGRKEERWMREEREREVKKNEWERKERREKSEEHSQGSVMPKVSPACQPSSIQLYTIQSLNNLLQDRHPVLHWSTLLKSLGFWIMVWSPNSFPVDFPIPTAGQLDWGRCQSRLSPSKKNHALYF